MTIAQDLDLSPQQERTLALQADHPEQLFRVEARYRLQADLEPADVAARLREVMARHEVLRLFLPSGGEKPSASALLDPGDALRFETCPAEEAEDRLAELRAPILGKGPILRALFIEHPGGAAALHLIAPATNADASTLDLLVAELLSRLEGSVSPTQTAPPHAAIVEDRLDRGRLESSKDLLQRWQEHLFAAPRVLEFPFGPTASGVEEFEPAALEMPVAADALAGFKRASEGTDCSLADWMLAAWRALLWRMSGEADLVLGLRVDARDSSSTATLGPLSSDVPCHIALTPELSFRELVQRARTAREDVSSSELFFSWALPGAHAEHDPSGDGFSFLFADHLGTHPPSAHRLECPAPFEMRLVLEGEANRPRLRLSYNAARIARSDAERTLERLETLLASAARSAERAVARLEVLGAAEREQILRDGAGPPCPAPPFATIQAQFEARAAAIPDAPAVHFEDGTLTYRELNERANRLAHHLRGLGVGPNTFVGILLRPSFELMVAIFGVLKAGGGYVPLDPEYPEERLRFLVEDAGVSVLIRGEDIDEQADAFGEHVVVLGRDARGLPGTETHDPEPVNAASDLVYMIYTSGSTGRPKGVRVNHRNLLLSTHARTLVYGGPPERFLLLSSFAFDSSVAGIFWTLSTGGALVLPPAGTQRDPVLVDQLIARWKVTHTLCLASHWAVLLSRGTPESFASLHTSVVSGEVFSTGLIELHDELTGGARLFNEYGPTEDTVWSTVFDCHSPFAGNRVPIGRAIPGTRVYVLNDAMQLAPIGSPGELYLGGKGVAQGYHNRPDRTAHAFVPDPFRPGTGARLYRSGDRVRMLSDGNLEFLGRFDDQVKLRGYRIELGEIEAVLGQMDELREAAVLCRESTAGDKHLVAYFSTRPGRSISARVLRERLGEKLPEYMVPSAFVELPELPRTPIGKLETEALPAPTSGRADLHESFVAPRNAVESVLAMIFEDVLERDEVGVHDDFFDLGGHSILAGRIVYHIREQLGAELPLRALFESPTIEGLATILRSEEDARRRVDAAAEVCLQVLEDGDDA